jgi:hypothetical protein
VAHALGVIRAWTLSNYHAFFHLYRRAPHMSAFLVDFLVERMRVRAFRAMVAAYRPTLPLRVVQRELAFADEAECRRFVVGKLKAVLLLPPPTTTTAAATMTDAAAAVVAPAVLSAEVLLDCGKSKAALHATLQLQRRTD